MENKYKIIVSYIQDLSIEIPNPETLITIRNTIPDYKMKVDIKSKTFDFEASNTLIESQNGNISIINENGKLNNIIFNELNIFNKLDSNKIYYSATFNLDEKNINDNNLINLAAFSDYEIDLEVESKGYFDVDVDSVIKPGNFTTEQRPCGPLSGVSTLDKTLTPMIPKLKKEMQNTNYIIPEDSQGDWLRGGLPTREMVRNKDYLRRYQEKTA